MQVKALPLSRWKGDEQTLVVFAAEGQPGLLGWKGAEAVHKRLTAKAREEGFSGRSSQVVAVHPDGGEPARKVLFAGVGSLQELGPDAYRRAAGSASKAVSNAKGISILFPERGDAGKVARTAQSIVEGAALAQYQFSTYRTSASEPKKAVEHLVVLHTDDVSAKDLNPAVERGHVFVKAVKVARDLVNEPPSSLHPTKLAERASKLGGRLRVKTFDLKWIERSGMGGLAGVGRGSQRPPVFIWVRYQGPKPKAKIALVGKGVTFDSGGLSLKGAEHMETMKSDMAGAAAVLGVMHGAEQLKLPLTLDGFIPAVENMPGGGAIKPGDVVKTFNGKTVEVLNTDAEGRLILADALAYAVKEKPDHVIDLATLTGAVVVALGTDVTGLMGTDRDLVKNLIAAGEAAGEPMWELPLVRSYRDQIVSKVSDLKNIGARREAGSIIGGLFLQEFVGRASWAHLDIAGVAFADKDHSYGPAGGTGNPVRALLTYLTGLSK